MRKPHLGEHSQVKNISQVDPKGAASALLALAAPLLLLALGPGRWLEQLLD